MATKGIRESRTELNCSPPKIGLMHKEIYLSGVTAKSVCRPQNNSALRTQNFQLRKHLARVYTACAIANHDIVTARAVAFAIRADNIPFMQGRPRFFHFLFILFCLACALLADSWMKPYPRTITSRDASKQAFIRPTETGAELVVSDISGRKTNLLWKAQSQNMPVNVHLSKNGSNIVTLNSWGGSGYGDHVVVIYSAAGKLANYSLEMIAPIPTNKTAGFSFLGGYFQSFPHSTSSRNWEEDSFSFFHPEENPKYFCIWLPWLERWVTFDLKSGAIKNLSGPELTAANERASKEARSALYDSSEIASDHFPTPQTRALRFLGSLRDPKDRALVEKSMRSAGFRSGVGAINSAPCLFLSSRTRAVADVVLARWDNNDEKLRRDAEHNLAAGNNKFNIPVNLGVAEGSIQFSKTVGNTGTLHIRLIPIEKKGSKNNLDSNQTFFSDFKNSAIYSGTKLLFRFENLTPGAYQMEIIHDIASPFATTNVPPYKPSAGDYVSTNAQTFTIQAGEKTSDLQFECRTLVK
jgi:hypothetical protein